MSLFLRFRRSARVVLGCLLVHGAAPAVVRAQEGFRLQPSLGFSEIYDSNLLFGAGNEQGDYIARVSPGIDSSYRSALMSFYGAYSLDAERFAVHRVLTGINAHRAHLTIRYRPAARTELAAAGGF